MGDSTISTIDQFLEKKCFIRVPEDATTLDIVFSPSFNEVRRMSIFGGTILESICVDVHVSVPNVRGSHFINRISQFRPDHDEKNIFYYWGLGEFSSIFDEPSLYIQPAILREFFQRYGDDKTIILDRYFDEDNLEEIIAQLPYLVGGRMIQRLDRNDGGKELKFENGMRVYIEKVELMDTSDPYLLRLDQDEYGLRVKIIKG